MIRARRPRLARATLAKGRKLIIKSAPGEVIKPVAHDPFRDSEDAALWTQFEDCDCPSLENAAVAETEADVAVVEAADAFEGHHYCCLLATHYYCLLTTIWRASQSYFLPWT